MILGGMLCGCGPKLLFRLDAEERGGENWSKANRAMGRLILPSFQNPNTVLGEKASSTAGNLLFLYDIATGRYETMETPLSLSHSAEQNPGNTDMVCVFDKDGPNACVVSLKRQKVLQKIIPQKDWFFNGHGVFSGDGKILYTAEYPTKNRADGCIMMRDATDRFKILRHVNTYGIQAHDMRFILNENILVVGHYGVTPGAEEKVTQASITFIDRRSGKLLEQVASRGTNQQLCHLAVLNDGRVAASVQRPIKRRMENAAGGILHPSQISAHQEMLPGPIMLGGYQRPWQILMPPELEQRMRFNFSLCIHEAAGIVAVTHIFGKMVSFWNINTQSLAMAYDLGGLSPSGVALTRDGSHFVVNAVGHGGVLQYYDVSTLALAWSSQVVPNFAISTPHILSIS